MKTMRVDGNGLIKRNGERRRARGKARSQLGRAKPHLKTALREKKKTAPTIRRCQITR